MKKDHIRDYATEAFRFYASTHMSAIQYREKIRREAIDTVIKRMGTSSGGGGSPTEAQLIYADKVVEEKISEIKDMEAVEKTLQEFEIQCIGAEIKKVVNIVYFTDPKRQIRKGEIRDRVIRACTELNISESTAYRYLKRTRLLFAHNRGLRAGEVENTKYY